MISDIQNHFKENKFVVVKQFLSPEVANLMTNYCKTVVRAMDFKSTYRPDEYQADWDGHFGDGQIPNAGTYYKYGDPLFDTLMQMSTEAMSNFTGLNLMPNYTYWRFYQQNDELLRHRDRASCEISTTLCLGYDVNNVDGEKYPNYNWPMYVEDVSGKELPIHLEPGDMIIYRGCEVDHWREKFPGLWHSQVFMHYNEIGGEYGILHDGRPFVGIPNFFNKGF